MLHSYCYMLEKVNPRTVTRIEVDEESIFKYLFLVFTAATRGFQYMRKGISIDGTFLKGPYKGVLLVATAQDGNNILSHGALMIQRTKMIGLGS